MQVKELARELYRAVIDDDITDGAAMLAYYAVMAIFPMLVFVGTLALLVIPVTTLHQGIAMATEALPHGVRDLLTTRIDSLVEARHTGFAAFTLAFALWGASRGAVGLQIALNNISRKRDSRSWVRRQLIAIGTTLGIAVLALVALGLLVVGPFVTDSLASWIGGGDLFGLVWSIGRWVGAGLLVLIVWAIIYKFLPDTDTRFKLFTPGAIVGVLGWLGISALFGIYISHFNRYEATYGALGGAIIFLLWLWLSAIALLFGAEVNDVLAERRHDAVV
ncbi:MAG TPA: YihY/virulence factor BrkB family protein [Kofleriaceae bacterium]|jgi:membrane protein